MAGKGLYANIHAKRKRGGKMRKKGAKGAPKASDFKRAKQTAKEKIMTKLCPRGKAAAKRKFKVYPSAYANAYASKICAGKIKDPSGVKRKDFRGPKPSKAMGGRIKLKDGSGKTPMTPKQKKFAALAPPRNRITYADKIAGATGRTKAMGGGLMEATERLKRQGLKGGGLCKRESMNREAIGKNS